MQLDDEALTAAAYLRVRDRLRRDIAQGVFAGGSRITIAAVQRRYGVSQMPAREALQQLQGEGLVRIECNKGATVPVIDVQLVRNMYDIRSAVESMLGRRAAERATPADIEALRRLQGQHEAAAASGDRGRILQANRDFHRRLNGIAGNTEALAIMEGRSGLVYAARFRHGFSDDRLADVIAQHRAMVDAVASHDAAAAEALARVHCEGACADLVERMGAAQEAAALAHAKDN